MWKVLIERQSDASVKAESDSLSRTQEDSCYQMLNNSYKFYLALENSVCRDYVTEKFFKILQYNVIPGTI